MKVYVIPKGTKVTLMDDKGNTKDMISKTETSFIDTITDPVREYNEHRRNINYALFYVESKLLSKENKQYNKIKVDYNDVEVLC